MTVPAKYFDDVASQIDGPLWQGGYPKHLADVPAHGFDVLVLCAAELQLTASTLSRVQPLGIKIVQVPLDDVEQLFPLDVMLAHQAAYQVARALRAGKMVLTTCAAGRNRSGLVNGLALVKWRKISGAEALARIQAMRTDALTNETFAKFLAGVPAPKTKHRYAAAR